MSKDPASFFAIWATDKPGTQALRSRLRPIHRAWLRDHPGHEVSVRLGGPTLDSSGEMNGTMLVVQADCIEVVQRFFSDDPYCRHGLFADVQIRPWQWGLGLSQTDPIQPATTEAIRP